MSRTRTVLTVSALLIAFLAAPLLADIIYLKDGRKFTGKVVSETGSEVKFKSVGGVLTFKRSEVERIEKGLTKKDEYNARRKKIAGDDVPGLLELARWCEEQRLVAERRRVYRELTKKVPNHPQVRRAMGQIHQDGKWVKRPKDYEAPTVAAGERKEEDCVSFVLPKGWKVRSTEAEGTVATGPAPYATPPAVSVVFSRPLTDLEAMFPKKAGWEKPKEVSAAGLKGFRSRRTVTEEKIALVEILAVLSGPDHGMSVRLRTLLIEEETNGAAVGLILDSLKIKAPPADYTSKHYKYSLNFPKGENWTHEEDKEKDICLTHVGDDPEEWAQLWIVAGAAGKEAENVKIYTNKLVAEIKRTGDITAEGEVMIGGEKAGFVDGTYLSRGLSLRRRVAWLTHGKKTLLIFFTQREFGAKVTDIGWTTLVKSFRFLD